MDGIRAVCQIEWHLGYDQFCAFLGLDPRYSHDVWERVRTAAIALRTIDEGTLARIAAYRPGMEKAGA